MKGFSTRCFIVSVLIIITCKDTKAQDSTKTFQPRYYLYVGMFSPQINTTFILNGDHTPGTILSLENDADMESHPLVFSVEGVARITRRSTFAASYANIDRESEWNIDRDITIRDTTFHVGARLALYFNTSFYSLSYRYNIFSKPTWNASLSFGIKWLQIETGVDLKTTNFSGYSESVTVPAPAPVFGIHGAAYMMKDLQVRYDFDYFGISVNGISASVLENKFGLEYYIIKNVGLGGSVNALAYKVKELPIGDNFDGEFKYNLYGLSLYLAARF